MFNFTNGIPAVVTSLKALASGVGFSISDFYGENQVSLFNSEWNILADFKEKYICYAKVHEDTVLKICGSPNEVEHELLHLLQRIAVR